MFYLPCLVNEVYKQVQVPIPFSLKIKRRRMPIFTVVAQIWLKKTQIWALSHPLPPMSHFFFDSIRKNLSETVEKPPVHQNLIKRSWDPILYVTTIVIFTCGAWLPGSTYYSIISKYCHLQFLHRIPNIPWFLSHQKSAAVGSDAKVCSFPILGVSNDNEVPLSLGGDGWHCSLPWPTNIAFYRVTLHGIFLDI